MPPKSLFLTWLFDNQLLRIWLWNTTNINKSFQNPTLVEQIFLEPPESYIEAAFNWSDSPEGPSFWAEASSLWKKYLAERKGFIQWINP